MRNLTLGLSFNVPISWIKFNGSKDKEFAIHLDEATGYHNDAQTSINFIKNMPNKAKLFTKMFMVPGH